MGKDVEGTSPVHFEYTGRMELRKNTKSFGRENKSRAEH
jgi:hypothetical protein